MPRYRQKRPHATVELADLDNCMSRVMDANVYKNQAATQNYQIYQQTLGTYFQRGMEEVGAYKEQKSRDRLDK